MTRRVLVAVTTCCLALVLGAIPAGAHDPIFVTAEQTTPQSGPLLLDGEVSWAVYGVLDTAGDTRGFEFDLLDGATLDLSLLIPDLDPEASLADDQLPRVELVAPDGTVEPIVAELRVPFDEPFSNTSYIRLAERDSAATAGRYQVVITGAAPARFTVAVGVREEFGTPAERVVDRGAPDLLSNWYAMPPAGLEASPAPTIVAASAVESVQTTAGLAAASTTDPAGVPDAVTQDEGGSDTWVVVVVVFGVALVGAAGLFGRRRVRVA